MAQEMTGVEVLGATILMHAFAFVDLPDYAT
jgi:hypothetical protein